MISLLTNYCWSFCVFLYSLHTSTNKLTSSAWNGSWCKKFNFNPSHFAWTQLMPHSKANLKINGNKVSSCFRSFLIGNVPDACLLGLYYSFHIYIYIHLTKLNSFIWIPKSMIITKDLPTNSIIGFIELYKQLSHCPTLLPFFNKFLTNSE